MIPPYARGTRTLKGGTAYEPVLIIEGAVLGRLYAIRIKAISVAWRVVADSGICGREVLASGSIGASPSGPTRVTGLPETIAAPRLLVELQSATRQEVAAESSWIPTVYGRNGGILVVDDTGLVVEG